MKRLMTIVLSLGIVLGLATSTFAQDKSTKKPKVTKAKTTKAKTTKTKKSTAKM